MTTIYFLGGNALTLGYDAMHWLEDGTDAAGEPCSRYAIGDEESVWLDDDDHEVETD